MVKATGPTGVFKTTTGYGFNSYQDVTFQWWAWNGLMNTDINGIPVAARKISDLTTRMRPGHMQLPAMGMIAPERA